MGHFFEIFIDTDDAHSWITLKYARIYVSRCTGPYPEPDQPFRRVGCITETCDGRYSANIFGNRQLSSPEGTQWKH